MEIFATTCFTRHVGKKAAEGSPCLVRVTDDDVDELVPITRALYIELLYARAVYVYLARAASCYMHEPCTYELHEPYT